MPKKRLPFFKFDTTAWRTGKIQFMTPEEQGIFIMLCCLVWEHDGTYKIDDFTHRYCNTSQPVFNQCLQQLTSVDLLLNSHGVLSIKFITKQIEECKEYSRKQSEKGKKSAEKRKRKQPVSTKKNEECRMKNEERILFRELCEWYRDLYISIHPDKQNQINKVFNLETWGDSIDKLIRIDGFTESQIYSALEFAVNDIFWSSNVISLAGLRKKSNNGNSKFANLFNKMSQPNNTSNKPNNIHYNADDDSKLIMAINDENLKNGRF